MKKNGFLLPILVSFIIINLLFLGFIYYYFFSKQEQNPALAQEQKPNAIEDVTTIPVEGIQISSFNLRDMSDNIIPINQINKKVNLIYFWTSWCPNCKVMTPRLKIIKDKINDQNIQFIGINIDSDANIAKEYVKNTNFPFLSFFDVNEALSHQLKVEYIPDIFLADSKLSIVLKIRRWTNDDKLVEIIKSYL